MQKEWKILSCVKHQVSLNTQATLKKSTEHNYFTKFSSMVSMRRIGKVNGK